MPSCFAAGGFIFPLFMAGASLGRGLAQIRGIPFISDVPPVLLSMSIATGAQYVQIPCKPPPSDAVLSNGILCSLTCWPSLPADTATSVDGIGAA